MDPRLQADAYEQLYRFYGPGADFRPGQLEAVTAVMTHRRVLVIQRTGWGKSLVYFLCARLLARQGKGLTLVISPLLTLMQDQYNSARAQGLSCAMLCSTTRHLRPQILADARLGRYELLFITPETLFSSGVQAILSSLRISLMVLDEAHCISDWGHDFRPNYGRLVQILQKLPHPPHILATTATADLQVIRDLRSQFGGFRKVLRGSLHRPGLSIQVLNCPSRVERCAWILEQLPMLSGVGLIYCLSRRDCDEVAAFLRGCGVEAYAYHSQTENARALEQDFRANRIRLLVCTIKLGLGYNKADIDFVIHFQSPGSLSAYYQQIGRAGRGTNVAATYLLCGAEDAEIHRSFRSQAFPARAEFERLFSLIRERPGNTCPELARAMAASPDALERTLRFLVFSGAIREEGGRYVAVRRSIRRYLRHVDAVTRYRERCWDEMEAFTRETGCLERALIRALGDPSDAVCGICASCAPDNRLPDVISPEAHQRALSYFSPLPTTLVLSGIRGLYPGLALSRQGQPGYAMMAEQALSIPGQPLPEELIIGSAVALRGLMERLEIPVITSPPGDVRDADLAHRLAEACGVTHESLLTRAFDGAPEASGEVPSRVVLAICELQRPAMLTDWAEALYLGGAQAVVPFVVCDMR